MEERVPSPLTFGEILKYHRLAAGLTQEALAERAGLSVRAITDLERGVNRSPRKDTLRRLAAALDLSSEEYSTWEAVARQRAVAYRPIAGAEPIGNGGSPPLVGRTQELRLLEYHLTGDGMRLMLLAGEPGIGKSRLLSEIATRASGHGWRVVMGGCQQRGGQEPYAPILHALARHIRGATPAQARADLRGCAWLVRLLPELDPALVGPLPTWPLPPDQERRLMFDAVVRFLSNVAGPAGTLLVLDDLQWAGTDTFDLLRAVVHAATDHRLRIVGAYRDIEVDPGSPLNIMLADLAQAYLATHCEVGPLAPDEGIRLVRSLIESGADVSWSPEQIARMCARVIDRAGGVPFFLVSYVQAIRPGVVPAGTEDQVPWTVTQSIHQRLVALPDDTRELLNIAAVMGRVVSRSTLAVVTSHQEEEILISLEVACRGRLMDEDGAQAYRFAHDVIREVVVGGLGPGRRALLHRRVAEALESHTAATALEMLAYHYSEAEAWDKALPYLVQAADKAMVAYAYQDALELYARAGAVCERLGSSALPTAVEAAQKRGFVNFTIRKLREAREDFDRMGASADRLGDRRQEGMALVHSGLAAWMDHSVAEAEAKWRAALAVGGETFADVRLYAGVGLMELCQCFNRHPEAKQLLEDVAELVPRVEDAYIQAVYGLVSCEPLMFAGHFDAALATLESFRSATDSSGQEILRIQHKWYEALNRAGKGEYEQALSLLDDALATGERYGDALFKGRCLNTLGWIYGELQDHCRAVALNTQSLEVALEQERPDPEIVSNARLNLGDSLMALERLDDAEEQFQLVERVVRSSRTEEQWMLWRYSQHLFHSYGELWLVRGDLERVLAYADECLRLAASSDSTKNMVKARRLRGQVFLAQGEPATAEQELNIALELAYHIGNPPQLWKTWMALGELRRVEGRGAEAKIAYRSALQIIDSVAASLVDETLRETFLSSRHVGEIKQRVGRDTNLGRGT